MSSFEEIKQKVSPYDICMNRGYEINSGGFISCDGERTPSLKIYENGWKCYRCNESGDIFDLIQHIEKVSRKEAFRICESISGLSLDNSSQETAKKYYDLSALKEAFDSKGRIQKYSRNDFRHKHTFELYKCLCLDLCLDDTEDIRIEICKHSDGWKNRENTKVNPYIDWLTNTEYINAPGVFFLEKASKERIQ